MRSLMKLIGTTVFAATLASPALAHGSATGSGFLHPLIHGEHFAGFFILGAMGGLFIRLFGGQLYVLGVMVAVTLAASHAHAPLFSQAGLDFAFGFVGVGLAISLAAARLSIATIQRLGLRIPKSERD